MEAKMDGEERKALEDAFIALTGDGEHPGGNE